MCVSASFNPCGNHRSIMLMVCMCHATAAAIGDKDNKGMQWDHDKSTGQLKNVQSGLCLVR